MQLLPFPPTKACIVGLSPSTTTTIPQLSLSLAKNFPFFHFLPCGSSQKEEGRGMTTEVPPLLPPYFFLWCTPQWTFSTTREVFFFLPPRRKNHSGDERERERENKEWDTPTQCIGLTVGPLLLPLVSTIWKKEEKLQCCVHLWKNEEARGKS